MSKFVFDLSYAMDIGTREEQQDCLDYFINDNACAAVVCDGMGGLEGGSKASRIATEKLIDLLKQIDKGESVPETYLRSVDILDEAVFSLNNDEGDRLCAGTTVVSAFIQEDKLYWMSVGDSRLYIFRGEDMIQATRDHNYFLTLDENDDFNPSDEDISKGNALISFIGIGGIEVMDISANPFEILEGDSYLLTTDGLFKALTDEEIKDIILKNLSSEETAQLLIQKATENREELDNISFIIIKAIKMNSEEETADETGKMQCMSKVL